MRLHEEKFDQSGKMKTYYGNTIISFVNKPTHPLYGWDCYVQDYIKRAKDSFVEKLTFLPLSSFHITVISLAREIDRGKDEWSSQLTEDAKFKQIDAYLSEIVENIPKPRGVKMRLCSTLVNKILVNPATEEDAKALASYRDAVAEATDIRHPGHESYQFHSTFAYQLETFNENEEADLKRYLAPLNDEIQAANLIFELPEPEFVIFEDMSNYEKDLNKRGSEY